MKHKSFVAVFAVMVAVLLSGLMSVVHAQDTIKIGGGFDLSGAESSLDLPASQGAQLAIKEINAAGGVLGKQEAEAG